MSPHLDKYLTTVLYKDITTCILTEDVGVQWHVRERTINVRKIKDHCKSIYIQAIRARFHFREVQ